MNLFTRLPGGIWIARLSAKLEATECKFKANVI